MTKTLIFSLPRVTDLQLKLKPPLVFSVGFKGGLPETTSNQKSMLMRTGGIRDRGIR